MNKYDAYNMEYVRFLVLKFLADTGVRNNTDSIQQHLVDAGYSVNHDAVFEALGWLQNNGLAEIGDYGDFMIAEVTRRGVDVAAGRQHHDGLRRPLGGIITFGA